MGAALSYAGAGVMRPFVTTDDAARNLATEPRTLAFVVGLTLVVAVSTGLAPLLHAMRADVNDALKSSVDTQNRPLMDT